MAILCPQQINSIDWLSNQKSIKAPQADQTLLLQHNHLNPRIFALQNVVRGKLTNHYLPWPKSR